jgi:hypothetical protein
MHGTTTTKNKVKLVVYEVLGFEKVNITGLLTLYISHSRHDKSVLCCLMGLKYPHFLNMDNSRKIQELFYISLIFTRYTISFSCSQFTTQDGRSDPQNFAKCIPVMEICHKNALKNGAKNDAR